jgi:hypothetical protein
MKVLYRHKTGVGKLNAVNLESEHEPAHQVCQRIHFMEGISDKLRVTIFSNRTGQ